MLASLLLAALLSADGGSCDVAAQATFDRTPFTYQIHPAAAKDAFTIYSLRYPSPLKTSLEQNNTVPAELYLPKGIAPGDARRPAVICLHILDGNVELVKICCAAMASRGVPAMWFQLPYYGQRAPKGAHPRIADPKLFVGAMKQAILDVQRSFDVLASREEIDPKRIGVMGISLGGILAASAAEEDPRLSRAAMILAGGDLLSVIGTARETRELRTLLESFDHDARDQMRQAIIDIDPLTRADALAARAAQGRVLMINASEDEVIPRASTDRLAAALGLTDKVVWLQGLGHYTAMAALPQALKTTADFFAEDLPHGVAPSKPSEGRDTPERQLVTLLRQVSEMLSTAPAEGRCHLVDCAFRVTLPDGKKQTGKFALVRGARTKFCLHAAVDGLADVSLGCLDTPWLASGSKTVFRGAAPPSGQPIQPFSAVEPQHLVKLQVASGALSAVAIAPEVLDRWVTLEGKTDAEGRPVLHIARKDKMGDWLDLELHDAAPHSASFSIQGVSGEVDFRAWQVGGVAGDAMFLEPRDVPVQTVASEDLARMFSAIINFVAESVR